MGTTTKPDITERSPAAKAAIGATLFSIGSSAVLAIVKGVAGVLGNSYALVADAIESTADVLSSTLVLLGLRYANRPPDKEHPYGHGRAEPLFAFLVVGFMIASALVIAVQSIRNIRTPHESPEPWTLIVLLVIVAWKEISFRIVMRKAVQTGSSALKADAWHHRSDAITSIAAFIGISIALLLGDAYAAADDWAALAAALFILYNCYGIFRPALGELMDEQTHPEFVLRIRRIALTVPGIRGTEKCFVRKAGTHYFVDLHACVDPDLSVRDGHTLAHRLKDTLESTMPEHVSVLVHVEPWESAEV